MAKKALRRMLSAMGRGWCGRALHKPPELHPAPVGLDDPRRPCRQRRCVAAERELQPPLELRRAAADAAGREQQRPHLPGRRGGERLASQAQVLEVLDAIHAPRQLQQKGAGHLCAGERPGRARDGARNANCCACAQGLALISLRAMRQSSGSLSRSEYRKPAGRDASKRFCQPMRHPSSTCSTQARQKTSAG